MLLFTRTDIFERKHGSAGQASHRLVRNTEVFVLSLPQHDTVRYINSDISTPHFYIFFSLFLIFSSHKSPCTLSRFYPPIISLCTTCTVNLVLLDLVRNVDFFLFILLHESQVKFRPIGLLQNKSQNSRNRTVSFMVLYQQFRRPKMVKFKPKYRV